MLSAVGYFCHFLGTNLLCPCDAAQILFAYNGHKPTICPQSFIPLPSDGSKVISLLRLAPKSLKYQNPVNWDKTQVEYIEISALLGEPNRSQICGTKIDF